MNKTDKKRGQKIESSKENGKEKSKEKLEDEDKVDKNKKIDNRLKAAEIGTNFLGKTINKIIDFFIKKEEFKNREPSSKEKDLQENKEYLKKRFEKFEEYFEKLSEKKLDS